MSLFPESILGGFFWVFSVWGTLALLGKHKNESILRSIQVMKNGSGGM